MTPRRTIFTLLVLSFLGPAAHSQQNVRVATYNVKFLDAAQLGNQGNRQEKLKQVISELGADVIGLQEIDDRAALERIFSPDEWTLVIDDDSGDDQDLALAVRKASLNVLGVGVDLDADDQDFLFPSSADNLFFPNRRDVLAVELQVPGTQARFWILVVHAKSRFDGRAATDDRREGAARRLIQVLEQQFDEREYVLLGDFNDNPDDRSLNILETGNPLALAGPEQIEGPFLINLAERLVVLDVVSHGLNATNIDPTTNRINPVDPGSRERNNDARGTNANTGRILFDQILIPAQTVDNYLANSIQVFTGTMALEGNNTNRASDHVPVFADFVFGGEEPAPQPAPSGVRIVALLPDPNGPDPGNERVTLRNNSSSQVNLQGWKLVDRAGNGFALSGQIGAGQSRTFTLPANVMPLNNSGDEVSVVDSQGNIVHTVSYLTSQVKPGQEIAFP